MLKQLTLENFKAFGSRTEIDLAPITLIFGENSAGKSTILQSLNLLKQTLGARQASAALLPRVENGFVDLGSFQELLFDHDPSRKLRIGIRAEGSRERAVQSFWRQRGAINGWLEISFALNRRTRQVRVSEILLNYPQLSEPLAKFKTKRPDREDMRFLRRPGGLRYTTNVNLSASDSQLYACECVWISKHKDFWKKLFKTWFSDRESIVRDLEERVAQIDYRKTIDEEEEWDLPEETRAKAQKRMEKAYELERRHLQNAIAFYSKEFTLDEYIERMVQANLQTKILLESFLPSFPPRRQREVEEIPELNLPNYGPVNVRSVRPNFNALTSLFNAGRSVALALESLFPMGPFRRPPERWYIFTGTSPTDVGYKGDHLPDLLFRQPHLVKKANSWLSRLEIGYQLKVEQVAEKKHSDLFELRLVDVRRDNDVNVALSDVGYGISQILPFLVQSLTTSNQIISIEQPEVHIHPRLQADLGDLIAEGIDKPHNHQYLIETHSEHLILRVQKLIREKKIDPRDVSVLFVSRGPSGSQVKKLRIDEEGDFIDEWPGGFFSERLRELL